MTEDRSFGNRNPNTRSRERSMSLPAALHFNQEIAQFSKQKMYDQACMVFETMLRNGVRPDVVTYNTMINVLVKSQRLPNAFALFDEMKSFRIAPTIITYTSLIDGCGKSNNIYKALNVYNSAKSSGLELNLHFFNAILNAALLNDNIAIIDQLLTDMNSYGLQANSVTYNTLLNGYYRMQSFDRLIEVAKIMISKHEEFSTTAQATILQSIELIRTKSDLENYLSILIPSRAISSNIQATQLVQQLITKRMPIFAQMLLQFYNKCNIEFSKSIYVDLLSLAGEFANLMLISWISSQAPTINVNSAYLDAFARIGNVNKVREILSDNKLAPSNLLQGPRVSAIQCLIAAKDKPAAIIVLETILNEKVLPSSTAERLLPIFYEQNDYEAVMKIFSAASREVYTLSANTADCVVGAAVRTSIDVDSVAQLRPSVAGIASLAKHVPDGLVDRIPWVLMIDSVKTPPPSSALFEVMIALLSKDLTDAAWAAFHRFVGLGVVPSENSIELALQTQRDMKSAENLLFVYEASRTAGVPLSSGLLSAVISSALASGDIAGAVRIRNDLYSAGVELNAEAQALFNASASAVQKQFPGLSAAAPKRRVGRNRAQTMPANMWTGMEEISNRSAFLALDMEDL